MPYIIDPAERQKNHEDIDTRMKKINQLLDRDDRPLLNSEAEAEREQDFQAALSLAVATVADIGKWEYLWLREIEVRRLMAEMYHELGQPEKAAEELAVVTALEAKKQQRIDDGLPLIKSYALGSLPDQCLPLAFVLLSVW